LKSPHNIDLTINGRKGTTSKNLDTLLNPVLQILAADAALEVRYQDHALSGQWKDFRDCHIKPDLVLLYQKPDSQTLRLVRLGSHTELDI